MELNGETTLSGADKVGVAMLSPGVKVKPVSSMESLIVGLGASFPVSSEKEFDVLGRISVFYHF